MCFKEKKKKSSRAFSLAQAYIGNIGNIMLYLRVILVNFSSCIKNNKYLSGFIHSISLMRKKIKIKQEKKKNNNGPLLLSKDGGMKDLQLHIYNAIKFRCQR